MLNIKAQSDLAEATADMMRAYALATARAAGSSMYQGVSLWSQILKALTGPARDPKPPGAVPVEVTCTQPEGKKADATAGTDPAFATYRSASGHAVAQVIVADAGS